MYHASRSPLKRVTCDSEKVDIVNSRVTRKLHKAVLHCQDPHDRPMMRAARPIDESFVHGEQPSANV